MTAPDLTPPQLASAPPPTGGDARSATSRLRRGAVLLTRPAAQAVWMLLVTAWATIEVARYGFNPTDQGLILAQAREILHGQVPHLDIISPRPLGSPLLHTIDYLIPGPLFLVSDAITVFEFVFAAAAVTALLLRRPIRSLGPVAAGAAAAAALLDLHTFPVSAWHTVDGIVLAAFGWLLVDAGVRAAAAAEAAAAAARGFAARRPALTRRAGLLVVGFAALCKQSFIPAAVVALALLLAHPRGRVRGRALIGDIVVLVVPAVAYAIVVAAAGGLADAVRQLVGGQAVWGRTLLVSFWGDLPANSTTTVLAALAVLAAVLVPVTRVGTRTPWLPAVQAAVCTACTLAIIVHGNLVRPAQSRPDWSSALFWVLLAAALADAAVRRSWRRPAFLVVVLAWMVSLSWGYDTPELVGGILVLAIVITVWNHVPATAWSPATVWAALRARIPAGGGRAADHAPLPLRLGAAGLAGVVLAGAAAGLLLHDRQTDVYRDRSRPRLSADLGAVSPELRGIRSGKSTLAYLLQIRQCVAAHPAASVAVLPDNAAVYPALHLNDPLPAVWLFPPELDGDAKQRVIAAMRALDSRGDYLVLFETTPADTLATRPAPATLPPDPHLFEYTGQYAANPPLEATLRAELHGQVVPCGSFVAVWSPAPPR